MTAAAEVRSGIMYAGSEGGGVPETKRAMQEGGCVVVHRYYDPDTGRYLQPDPFGMQSDPSSYSYANGNPFSFTDTTGQAPGDRYSTERDAAVAALTDINPFSKQADWEYGGWVYYDETCGDFSYTYP